MAPIAHLFAFFTLILSVTALTIPHSHNLFNHRRAVAHAGIEADIAVPVVAPATPKVKRSLNKRCVPMSSGNPTTSTSSSSYIPTSYTSSSSFSSSSSVAPSSTPAPFNVAPSPVLPSSSSSSTHTPTPTPTPTPSSSSSSSTPVQTTSASSGGSSSNDPSYLIGTQSGQGTYYETGLGACGITNTDSDYIAAVSHLLFDTFPNYDGVNPNDNPVCNKKVTASYGGKSVTVAITDRCTGCAITDLDFSPSAFSALADESLGRIDITWKWD